MSYTILYNPEAQIIEVNVRGTVTLDDFQEIILEGIRIAKEKECFLVLSDFREATLIKLSTVEIFHMPAILAEIAARLGMSATKFRRATVIARKDAADGSFAETVMVNAGQNSKFFQDIDEARKWLTGK